MTIFKSGRLVPSGQFFNNLIDDVMNHGLTELIGNDILVSQPSINVHEFDHHYQVQVAAPGMSKGDFQIQLQNGLLTIESTKSNADESSSNTGKFLRREFHYSSFKRSFQLPDHIDQNNINAAYTDGILSIKLPKLIDQSKSSTRTINIS